MIRGSNCSMPLISLEINFHDETETIEVIVYVFDAINSNELFILSDFIDCALVIAVSRVVSVDLGA